MKFLLFFGFIIISHSFGFTQRVNHSVLLGVNLTSSNPDLSTSSISNVKYKNFKSAQPALHAGYRFLYSITENATLQTGLGLTLLKTAFNRPFYNEPGDIDPNLSGVREVFQLARISIPIQASLILIDGKWNNLYIAGGGGVMSSVFGKRNVDYFLASPPNGFVPARYSENRAINYSNSKLAAFLMGGLGTEIVINSQTFFIEVGYHYSLGKTKINTMHNIEQDNSYTIRFNQIQLSFGYTFSSFF